MLPEPNVNWGADNTFFTDALRDHAAAFRFDGFFSFFGFILSALIRFASFAPTASLKKS
jgi:hypothetical protein